MKINIGLALVFLHEAESSAELRLIISKKLTKALSRKDYLCRKTDVEIN